MNIHELNTKAITNPAYVALDDGSDTYKLDLNAKLSTMQSSISGAESDIVTAQADITLLQTNMGQAQGAISSAQGEIEDLQSDLNALSTQTSASIGNLQTELDATEDDVTDLKEAINQIETDIYTFTNVPLNTTANNWILNGSGLSTSYADGCLRKYEVKEGQLLYLKLAHDAIGGVYQFQSNASVGASSNPYVIGSPVNDAADGLVDVPTGATWLITSQLKTNTTNKVQLVIYDTKEKADDAYTKVNDLVGIYNVNLVDTNNFVSGKYVIYTDGTLGNNSNFSASDFIPVEGGKNYKLDVTNAYYGAWYTSNKVYISGQYSNINSEHSVIYAAPENAAYFRISCQTAQLSTLDFSANAEYNQILQEDAFVNQSSLLNRWLVISPSDNLVDVFLNNSGRYIYISAGSYDIIQHYKDYFGDSYFDNYVSYNTTGKIVDAGLPIQRDTVVRFSPAAKLTCNYTGSNTAVTNNFSAFALYGNVTIDGLNLSCSGIRDAIHDDFDTSYNGHTIIKNCNITSSTRCIAGGMHTASTYVIENNIFNGATSTGYDVTYHNSNNANALNRMTIKDNYFSEGVSLRYYGTSTEKTEVLVCNNSMHKAIDKRAEASATVDNINIKDWNNIIRS